MDETATGKRQRWAPLIGSAVLAVILIGGSSLINGLKSFVEQPSRLLLVGATTLILGLVLWNYTARQPRIGIDSVQLRKVPSTVVPGAVELILRNAGGDPADIVVLSVGHLGQTFSGAERTRKVEADLADRLKSARPLPPSGALVIPAKQTLAVSVEVPFSERAWVFDRGESTLLVAGRIQYRDRVFQREKRFCQFLNQKTNSWTSCPFLN
jgi:hypothetical protein